MIFFIINASQVIITLLNNLALVHEVFTISLYSVGYLVIFLMSYFDLHATCVYLHVEIYTSLCSICCLALLCLLFSQRQGKRYCKCLQFATGTLLRTIESSSVALYVHAPASAPYCPNLLQTGQEPFLNVSEASLN